MNRTHIYASCRGARKLEEADPPGAIRLNSSLRQTINTDLIRSGFDGNKRFDSVSQALTHLAEVLERHGFEIDEVLTADLFLPKDDGKRHLRIAKKNPGDSFAPLEVTNSQLWFAWHRFETTGRWEIVAYLS